ncbi:expressed unknown protein [Seminavis robusta]|uniref:Uncharacterized protein n=1 Tax=Seminavis robusta TaxID=568900 RepID=A0A9N8DWE8_9STRA|nr:expressed unknown protein [Seminavis robusta]|eukprot:Sro298_g111060.1 n/a (357) ;mRNA; f:25621-26691
MLLWVSRLVSVFLTTSSVCLSTSWAFHDCIEASVQMRQRRENHVGFLAGRSPLLTSPPCAGGICVGMKNGPHQGGNASYPVAWNGINGTFVHSTMTVPEYPRKLDGITYYLWTDIFFGDGGLGRMNQFVPQLLLGDVLDGSSGYPDYKPSWKHHDTWVFGAHYFFETWNATSNRTNAHAAYGKLYPTFPGETLYTSFQLLTQNPHSSNKDDIITPQWILTMGVVGDQTRVSRLVVDQPYMGMGAHWQNPTTSWLEPSYQNMCINACWEIYGAFNAAHLPSSGGHYNLTIAQPSSNNNEAKYNFTYWVRDEGNGVCPWCKVTESHKDAVQTVLIDVGVRISDNQLSFGKATTAVVTG